MKKRTSGERLPEKLFFRNSGIFDLERNLIGHGSVDTESVHRIQSGLTRGRMAIVINLTDTMMPVVCDHSQRYSILCRLLDRTPFLITRRSVFFVAYPCDVRPKDFLIGDVVVRVINRVTAKKKLRRAVSINSSRP